MKRFSIDWIAVVAASIGMALMIMTAVWRVNPVEGSVVPDFLEGNPFGRALLLVLLVIFLTLLPITQQGIDTKLPAQVQRTPEIPPTTQIVAEVSADRRLRINRQEVPINEAAARFEQIYAGRRDKTLYVMGDGSLEYGEVMKVIDIATGAGADRIGIITAGMRAR